MPDWLVSALAVPGLGWMALTIGCAGIVRGFTGFGTALIFVPVAGRYLPPADVIIVITLTGIASTSALLPRAWGYADRGEVALMAVAAMLTVPLGVWAMTSLPQDTIRWIVTGIAGVTLVSLVTGWRYRGMVTRPGLVAIGLGAGLAGGMTGLTGPVVILFYLAGLKAAQTVRANTILYLAMLDVVVFANLLIAGVSNWQMVVVAGLLAVPYFITSLIGQHLFDPRYEKTYRWAAYAVIAVAVVSGVPLWD
ncbi:sulfite exporter TauE/SafE family protein [Primorskyibacter aestuariivivens]|uniref:sulfite exporter TauE/SafE family protein n=1 Tax=Primorskyibacter aestuariivivens TaxID=1888912 RepID=UPI0022FFF808|nr:sulfite exporter TauE/SafE family protein [Primorskyibacter aestuariivivens]MDA7427041.1 sulfite exporter TauE/SafE family protein [Primorskyibacter aestuariivivens]